MFHDATRRTFALAIGGALFLLSQPFQAAGQDGSNNSGFVYVMTNESTGNAVLVFHRNADGSVNQVQRVSTHGLGSGGSADPLGSQGALTLSADGRLLFAVNAGSNTVTSLAVTSTGLQALNFALSGGTMPVSVAQHGDTVYVLNAGGTPNVTAFRINSSGQLKLIAGSSRPLPGGAGSGPAQVGVTPDGQNLVVTEKNTNMIDLFPIAGNGLPGGPTGVPSNGATPFGFAFGRDQTLIVSEAPTSSLSSYHIVDTPQGLTLQTITSSLADGGGAACWVVTDYGGRLAFTTNSATNTISSVGVSMTGSLKLLASIAASVPEGTTPIDMALTRDGGFLYTVGTGNGTLTGFSVVNGALSQVTSVANLPASIQGIAAR